MTKNIFISTTGHCATRFIADIFENNGFDVYHGNEIKDFRSFFKSKNNKTEKQLFIHINKSYGIKEYEFCKLNNIKFFGLIRNPIDKILSMTRFYFPDYLFGESLKIRNIRRFTNLNFFLEKISNKKKSLFLDFFKINFLKKKQIIRKFKKEFYNLDPLRFDEANNFIYKNFDKTFLEDKIKKTLSFAITQTFKFDKELIYNLDFSRILKYEDFISNPLKYLNYQLNLNLSKITTVNRSNILKLSDKKNYLTNNSSKKFTLLSNSIIEKHNLKKNIYSGLYEV